MNTTADKPILDQTAALRHVVYRDLLDLLPVASYDQAITMITNLKLCSGEPARYQRQLNACLMRFLTLRVTPGDGETAYRGATLKEIEQYFNRKYGERLTAIAGFHRRNADTHVRSLVGPALAGHDVDAGTLPAADKSVRVPPWRLNLPFNCALYGYRSPIGFYNGILCHPLDRLNTFFLLSSAKFGGAKAVRLQPRDEQYFTQYEEVSA